MLVTGKKNVAVVLRLSASVCQACARVCSVCVRARMCSSKCYRTECDYIRDCRSEVSVFWVILFLHMHFEVILVV